VVLVLIVVAVVMVMLRWMQVLSLRSMLVLKMLFVYVRGCWTSGAK
jgi:hypothetical protein